MICPRCGSKIPDHSKFCSKCGAVLMDSKKYMKVMEKKVKRGIYVDPDAEEDVQLSGNMSNVAVFSGDEYAGGEYRGAFGRITHSPWKMRDKSSNDYAGVYNEGARNAYQRKADNILLEQSHYSKSVTAKNSNVAKVVFITFFIIVFLCIVFGVIGAMVNDISYQEDYDTSIAYQDDYVPHDLAGQLSGHVWENWTVVDVDTDAWGTYQMVFDEDTVVVTLTMDGTDETQVLYNYYYNIPDDSTVQFFDMDGNLEKECLVEQYSESLCFEPAVAEGDEWDFWYQVG